MDAGASTDERKSLLQNFVRQLTAEVDKDRSIWIVERLTPKSGIIVKGKYACCYSDRPVGLVIVVCKADELTKDLTNPEIVVVDYEQSSKKWVDTAMNRSYSNEELVRTALTLLSKA
ncbi:MAG: hypothetical protein C5B53_06105 [Candidatus Melainabacteria bacterium]|nr:MAG: hypothetical protein C5B53_06105 [Candidatus Melainabacteria bacterium]